MENHAFEALPVWCLAKTRAVKHPDSRFPRPRNLTVKARQTGRQVITGFFPSSAFLRNSPRLMSTFSRQSLSPSASPTPPPSPPSHHSTSISTKTTTPSTFTRNPNAPCLLHDHERMLSTTIPVPRLALAVEAHARKSLPQLINVDRLGELH